MGCAERGACMRPGQRLLYLHARTPSVHSGNLALNQIEPWAG